MDDHPKKPEAPRIVSCHPRSIIKQHKGLYAGFLKRDQLTLHWCKRCNLSDADSELVQQLFFKKYMARQFDKALKKAEDLEGVCRAFKAIKRRSKRFARDTIWFNIPDNGGRKHL